MNDYPGLIEMLTELRKEGLLDVSLGGIGERLALHAPCRAHELAHGRRELGVLSPTEGWLHLGFAWLPEV